MNVRLSTSFRFNAGVYYDNKMRINEYNLKVWMTTNSTNPANHNIAFERMKYFIYNTLDSTIFIDGSLEEQCQAYIDAGLDITTLPGSPVDQLIGIMLYYKLNAIMEDRMIVVETEFSSSMGDSMVYLHSEHETTTGVEPAPWWSSPDPVHCDSNLIESDKVVAIHQTSAWRELDMAWPDEETETGNTVVFANFKKTDDTE